MYEAELDQHMREYDQIDESAFCVGCGEIVYLHDRDTYETCQDGVICKGCAGGQRLGEWFNERVANGVDPIEAAKDADACMSFEDWQEEWELKEAQYAKGVWDHKCDERYQHGDGGDEYFR